MIMKTVKDFWDRLQLICKTRKVTQIEMCTDLNIYLQCFRNKKSTGYYPTVEQLILISDYFNVTLDYLLKGEIQQQDTEELDECKALAEQYKERLDKIQTVLNEPFSSSNE